MVEAQLVELATVQSVQAQLMVSEAARTNLQAQVEGLGRTAGERKIGVDTRNLGRPSQFNGTDSAWRVWLVVFRSYAALVHPALKDEMQRVERLSTAETNVGLLEGEQVEASSDLYHLLLHSTSGPALDRVVTISYFSSFFCSLHSGRSKVTRAMVGRDIHQPKFSSLYS